MPVHSKEKKESAQEEMEVDYGEQEGSSSEEEDTDTSSGSEDGESSEMDDEDCERRRLECLDEMTNLEKQFTDLKDQLYKERLNQVDAKLQEVISGKAPEYLEPLANLQENMQIRTKSEKLLLFDTVQTELEEKIRRLEEDRHSIDITSELWNDELQSRKNKKKDPFSPDKKKKPVMVSDILQLFTHTHTHTQYRCKMCTQSCILCSLTHARPYIVYMLHDLDILEDWTAIRKAMATLGPHRVKAEVCSSKSEKQQHTARSEDGRLLYDGEWFNRGQNICIDKKDEFPTSALITTINHEEVWFKRSDGSKSKLYISQLQKGKYTIKHA
ncbi:Breast cancer metastasis-suppressor 1-like protein-A [Bagarius yarrelli]|uniref:Breast cancer metastasis-suppressor 1-like protein-A n=1 Tax=Bagarius yarrelli TaxID=175774 RepID=A0A556VU38_BAGYA|nr:Breast cancer metastasis-suppressor 1-like protein-A [Bagarius yarrelli]